MATTEYILIAVALIAVGGPCVAQTFSTSCTPNLLGGGFSCSTYSRAPTVPHNFRMCEIYQLYFPQTATPCPQVPPVSNPAHTQDPIGDSVLKQLDVAISQERQAKKYFAQGNWKGGCYETRQVLVALNAVKSLDPSADILQAARSFEPRLRLCAAKGL